jgi:tryptophan synthase alpha subunit
LAGSATGEESIAMLKAKEDEKKAATFAAKKNNVAAKKSKDTSAGVIAGAAFIDNVKKNRPTYLGDIRVDDYYTLKVHATRFPCHSQKAKEQKRQLRQSLRTHDREIMGQKP